jgi:hypothetical protein
MPKGLQVKGIKAGKAGTYRMVVFYANADKMGNHQYNVNVIDRSFDIAVNGGAAKRVYFRNNFSWSAFKGKVVDVELRAGDNAVEFLNAEGAGPIVDRIELAPFEP